MGIREIIEATVEFVFSVVGVEHIAVGLLAIAVAVLWYLRELADVFVVLARCARMLSIIGLAVQALYVAGTVTGVLEVGNVGQLFDWIPEVLN